MFSIRLQYIQLGGALAAGLCCLALGALSLVGGMSEYLRVREAEVAFGRFEAVTDAVNAVAAERAPANLLIAAGGPDDAKTMVLKRARDETDRLLDQVERTLSDEAASMSDLRFIVDDVQARLHLGRQMVDAFVATEPGRRRSADFRNAMEQMYEAASVAATIADRFGHRVVGISPEASIEVFLGLAAAGLRDHAGRLGSYVVMAQRERGTDPATMAEIQTVAGRLRAGNRALRILSDALPRESAVAARLGEVERRFFDAAMPMALATAARAATGDAAAPGDFAGSFARSLSTIEDLRQASSSSSHIRLQRIGAAAFGRAAIAGTLTLLVCLILVSTIVVFRRALFSPLLRAREEAIAIAKGDLSEPAGGERVGGEVGEMLAGLHAIRDDQRWRRELEQQQAEMARQLKRLSETDMLTGLLNRRAVEDLAGPALAEADRTDRTVGLLLFDVDRFKSINDTFGHGVGDDVLRTLARTVGRLLRPQDSFGRFGGEEFVILLPDVSAESARAFAVALRGRLPDLVRTPADGRVTASFGLAIREPGCGTSWEGLVAIADRRLYAAKKAGRDQICDEDAGAEAALAG